MLVGHKAEPRLDRPAFVPVAMFPGELAPAFASVPASETGPSPKLAASPPKRPPAPPELAPVRALAALLPIPLPPAEAKPQVVEPPVDEARLEADRRQDPIALSVARASATANAGCQLTAWLQAALQADPAVRAALPTVPVDARSAANAIMLWDRSWVPQPGPAREGVGVIRTALMVGVLSAPPTCRLQAVRGPELMTLTDTTGTVVLAVGSGEWRWADLLAESAAASAQ
jgi:hypothetical protein